MKLNLPHPAELLPVILLFLLASAHPVSSQHSYQLRANLDVPLLTVGTIGTATGLLLKYNNDPLTLSEIGTQPSSDVLSFDQSALDNYSPAFKTASDGFLYASYAFPLSTLLLPDIRSDPLTIGIMLGEAVLLNEAFTGIFKAVVSRPRPFTYNTEVPNEIRIEKGNNHSFFSGHTSYAATLSFFTAKVIADNTENTTLKAIVWTGAIVWPAATGYFRYQAGRHFPTDVITGYAVGAAIGYLVPHLHKVNTKQSEGSVQLSHIQVGPSSFRAIVAF